MVDHYQVRSQQIAAAIEATPGTAETLAVTDVLLRPEEPPTWTPAPNLFDNNELSEDLSMPAKFTSGERANLSFRFILKNSGTVGTSPAVARFLRACGLKEELVESISIGAVSGGDGTFREGEIYSATGGKTGIIEQDTTGTTLRYIALTGGSIANTDVVSTPDGDSATASSASANFAVRYTPDSTKQDTLTLARLIRNTEGTAAEDTIHTIRGAMGNLSLELAAHDIMRANFEFQGVFDSASQGNLFSNPTFESANNEDIGKLIDSVLQLDGSTVVPSSMTVDLGNGVELDPDPTSVGGGTKGYDRARILRREPTLTIDPRRVTPTVFDEIGRFFDGSLFAFRFVSGGGTDPGQVVEIVAESCQIQGWTEGNRSDFQTWDGTIALTRRLVLDTDYKIYFR